MGEADIIRYMRMERAELDGILSDEEPPLDAVRAASVLQFMEDYHLHERSDALKQFIRLRRSQADMLGLAGEERVRFMEGFEEQGE
jgi:hypothetical protein